MGCIALPGLVTLWNVGALRCTFPTSGADANRIVPRLKRLGSEETVGASRDEVTRNSEGVVGGGMQRQEPLGGPGRLESLELALSSSYGHVRAFRSVVRPLAPGMR